MQKIISWNVASFRARLPLVKMLIEKENPDVVVGLFHTGGEQNETDEMIENGSENIARNVPGFDVIFLGHDHVRRCEKIVNVEGDSVLLVNPGSMAKVVSDVTLTVRKQNGNLVGKSVCGTLTDMKDYPVDKAFMNEFAPQYDATEKFVSRKVGARGVAVQRHDGQRPFGVPGREVPREGCQRRVSDRDDGCRGNLPVTACGGQLLQGVEKRLVAAGRDVPRHLQDRRDPDDCKSQLFHPLPEKRIFEERLFAHVVLSDYYGADPFARGRNPQRTGGCWRTTRWFPRRSGKCRTSWGRRIARFSRTAGLFPHLLVPLREASFLPARSSSSRYRKKAR